VGWFFFFYFFFTKNTVFDLIFHFTSLTNIT